MNSSKSIRLSLLITNIFLVVLLIFTVTLPLMVTWYVETMHRSASLPTTILVTCYPCVPFAGACLLLLRKILKNALADELFSKSSVTYLKRLSFCALVISVITLIAGKFYLPFFIVGATFAFISLLVFSFKCVFCIAIEKSEK